MLWSDTSRPSGFSRGLYREEGERGPKGGEVGVERKTETQKEAGRVRQIQREAQRNRQTDRQEEGGRYTRWAQRERVCL